MSKFPDFSQFCEAACIKIWGEPDLRTPRQFRWSGNNGDNGYGARTYDVRKHVWYDRGAERGGSTLELIAYSKGLPNEKLRGPAFYNMWQALHELGVGAPAPAPKSKGGGGKWPPILATYPYPDENNVVLFEVVRFDTTDPLARFKQRRPDGKGGWIWNTKGVRKVLYRLPQLIAAVKAGERIILTEGESDGNTAVTLGYVATTNPGGIDKWRNEHDEFFRGADVVVVSDNDAHGKGQADADKKAKRLAKVAAHVRIIMFTQKDLRDWVAAGGTREQMDALIDQAPEIKPPSPKEEEDEPTDADAEIERLMGLSDLEYEQQKRGVAKKLGVGVSYLDRLRKAEHANDEDGKQGQAISFPEIEPWPGPVSGASLLDDIATTIRKHVVMPDHARDICALWTAHTYLIKRFKISPKNWIRSPVKRCGKSTLLEVLAEMVFRAWTTGSITKAALFRVIDKWHPTLLIDEVDTFVGEDEELRGILNQSHRYDGAVTRTEGDDHEPRRFSVYAAVALSGIGGIAETLIDRSVIAGLQRRRPSETIVPLRIGRMGHLHELRRRITRWVADHEDRIAEREPEMPSIIDREADNWHVLLAIADEAGGKWPERARKAAEVAHTVAANDPAARLELLLGDIRSAFADNGTKMPDLFGAEQVIISSAKLVKVLVALEGRPWAETGRDRQPLTQNKLALMLRPLGIGPDKVGPKKTRLQGYTLSQFEEAFSRYLPPEGASKPDTRTPSDEMGTSDISQVDSQGDRSPDAKCEKPNNDGPESGSPVGKGGGPQTTNGGTEPGISQQRIRELGEAYKGRAYANAQATGGDTKTAECDAWLRATLRKEVDREEHVEIEFKRVMDVVFAM